MSGILWSVAAVVLPVAPVLPERLDIDGMYGLSTVERHEIHSQSLATTYTLLVRVPESFSGSDTAKRDPLPVVYLLDGGLTFPTLGGYYQYLHANQSVPEMLVVGVSYGTADWRQGNQRGRDFTAPSSEQEHYGGVEAFLDFLASDVFPLVEELYPADPERRILFGQSLGGQAAIYAAMHRPRLFWGQVASNPALHRNLDFFLQSPVPRDPAAPGTGSPTRLFVSSASDDDPRFREPVRQWVDHWTAAGRDWILETRILPGHDHFSAAPEAFRQGLLWLFSEPAAR